MKAAIYTHYGPPSNVSIQTIPTPSLKDNEIQVKVSAAAVTAADARIRAARFPKGFGFLAKLAFGPTRPRNHVLGSCFSGVVESVGTSVSSFAAGDQVCGMTGIKMGAHAQYVVVPGSGSIALKPATINHEQAAAMLFGGTAALYFLRDVAQLSPGETVLVNGASGAVGTNAVQLATHLGGIVTAVTSGDNTQLVQSLGAKHVIDYKKQAVANLKDHYDVVLDAVGNINIQSGRSLLSKKGRLVLMVASLGQMISSATHKNVLTGTAPEKKADIIFLLHLMEKGELTAVIDSTYPLAHIVDAHTRADSTTKKGNIVLTIH